MEEEKIHVKVRIPELNRTVEMDVGYQESGRKILGDVYEKFKPEFNVKGVDDVRKMVLYESSGRNPLNRSKQVIDYAKPHERFVEVVVGTIDEYKKKFFDKVKEDAARMRAARAASA
ncbi:MAG: hypothetical protein QXU82_01505 [Candidatus Aenigmatarchaeota archaeon]